MEWMVIAGDVSEARDISLGYRMRGGLELRAERDVLVMEIDERRPCAAAP
jgi:hypothetical protein